MQFGLDERGKGRLNSFDMNGEHSKIIFGLLNTPPHWHSKARKLKYCADLLFKAFLTAKELSQEEQAETQDSEIDDVATLLYGMSMEAILKAALLKEGVAKIDSDGMVNWGAEEATQHDLVAMCSLLNSITLNADQEKLMERMSAFVCWAGKYPTPKKIKIGTKDFKGFLLSNQPGAANKMLPVAFDENDKKVFDVIYASLNE
jgi:hypothetical protein